MTLGMILDITGLLLAFSGFTWSLMFLLKGGEKWLFGYCLAAGNALFYLALELFIYGSFHVFVSQNNSGIVYLYFFLRTALLITLPYFVFTLFRESTNQLRKALIPFFGFFFLNSVVLILAVTTKLETEYKQIVIAVNRISPILLASHIIYYTINRKNFFIGSAGKINMIFPAGGLVFMFFYTYDTVMILSGKDTMTRGAFSLSLLLYGIWNLVFFWFLLKHLIVIPVYHDIKKLDKILPDEDKLTPREREILDRVIQGRSNKEIAHGLNITESTVKVHLSGCFRKFGVHSRVELMNRLYGVDQKTKI
ncbi:MAG: response regulator transcription factor [Spirochaetia bacterium]